MNLYQIAAEHEQIFNEMYDEEGNENPQALTKLEGTLMAFEQKSISIASWIKNMEIEKAIISEAKKQIEEAKKNVAEREKAYENKIDRWKNYLKENMERCGINKISCPKFIISLMKKPPSVNPYDESKIPDDYWVIERRLDKAKLLEHMKNGVIVEGANLNMGMRIQIK